MSEDLHAKLLCVRAQRLAAEEAEAILTEDIALIDRVTCTKCADPSALFTKHMNNIIEAYGPRPDIIIPSRIKCDCGRMIEYGPLI